MVAAEQEDMETLKALIESGLRWDTDGDSYEWVLLGICNAAENGHF
jgi:hypothetical protein